MSYLAIKSPAPTFKTNRRKCGWGSALTTCDICGKIMMGHNRGICSKCMRSNGRRRGEYDAFSPVYRFAQNDAAEKAIQAQALRETYANGGTK